MAKKKETILEKAEHVAEAVVKEIKEEAEEVAEKITKEVKEVAEEVEEEAEEIADRVKELVKGKDKKTSKKKLDDEKKEKLAKLLEKAKALEGKVEEVKDVDLKKKVKPVDEQEKEKENALAPMEDYLKASIHLGTRVITPDMRKYVYRRRADGLAVFNTALLDDLIREGAEYLSDFPAKDVILVCKREAGWHAVKKFSEITGIRCFTKKYPAGILTNTTLENFMETELVFICDPWLDKNALEDAGRIRIPVLSICDTNNFTKGITKIIPGNNKSAKSLGIILYLLAKIYVEKHKIKVPEFTIEDFVEGWNTAEVPQ